MPSEPRAAPANVSRETSARLERFAALVRKWSPRINLVAPGTLDALETRHMADSAQLLDHAVADAQLWADLGSGGGFPGAVVAILAAERRPSLRVVCVESDQRKATFLRTVSRETGVRFEVIADRAEAIAPLGADVVSARALAHLPKLLGLVARHLAPEGVALLPKGARHAEELAEARNRWRFACETAKSGVEADAVILKIGAIRRVRDPI